MTDKRRIAQPISYDDWAAGVQRYCPDATIEQIALDGGAVVAAVAKVGGRSVASWAKLDGYVPHGVSIP